ncbi:MAG: undecaprenyldiphospho-muramoylpentapeptide beta-N-acetylglucosaminyltransferase [Anaerorhabdus sp.]
MRILMSTGGTGGHIYPALSLAKTIEKKYPHSSIVFIGSENRMEKDIIPRYGYSFYGLKVSGMNGSLINKLTSGLRLIKSYSKSKKIIKKYQPEIVIGFGNYITVPVVLAASHLKIKTMIHEQNSVPGKANRFLARIVDAVVGCYEENKKDLGEDKTRILGNPRASEAEMIQKDETVLQLLELDPAKQTVIFVMGSLGSSSVNEVLKKAVSQFKDKSYQVLIVTGEIGYESFKQGIDVPNNVKLAKYIDGLHVMKQASLLVIRGGATTAAEVVAMGIPSIIIPSPYVPHDHQTKNAQQLVQAGVAKMILETELNEMRLITEIDELMNDENQLKKMSSSASELAKPKASEDILHWIEELIR